MPTLSITIPQSNFRKIQTRARREGFQNPNEWARFLLERNLYLEESPKNAPAKIISEMKKTGLYQKRFLNELKKSIHYADATA
jgi:hypothetical protein